MQRDGARTPNRSFGAQVLGKKSPGSAGRSFGPATASRKTSATGGKRNLTPSRSFGQNRTPGKAGGDRFCANRSSSAQELAKFELSRSMNNSSSQSAPTSPSRLEASRAMSEYLNGGVTGPGDVSAAGGSSSAFKILGFQGGKAPAPPLGHSNANAALFSTARAAGAASCRKHSRHIPAAPDRVLDAPSLGDDFYLNLIDWSSSDILAVGLRESAYVWHAATGDIDKIAEVPDEDYVSSVSWSADGSFLAVGLSTGVTELYDHATKKRLRALRGSEGQRVGSLSWNAHVISTGASNGVINHFDVRAGNPLVLSVAEAHTQEVCGLRWSPDGRYLASGGNDNRLLIWNAVPEQRHTNPTPLHTITQHQAAIKALAWCPWQSSLLASGGGTADRMIRCWNVNTGACLASVDAESQVSSLLWSSEYRELLSSHGYPSHQLTLWKYPALTKVTELLGHGERVLGTAMSADSQRVVSAGADESLRIWNCFAKDPQAKAKAAHKTGLAKPASQFTRRIR